MTCVCVGAGGRGCELEDLAFRVVGTELDCPAEQVEAIHLPGGGRSRGKD